jgi:hypothetical protein
MTDDGGGMASDGGHVDTVDVFEDNNNNNSNENSMLFYFLQQKKKNYIFNQYLRF